MYARERAPDDERAAVESRLQRRVLARAALAVVLVHDQRPRLVPRLEALCDVRNRVCRRFARCVVWVGSDVDFTAFVVDSLPVGVSSLQRAADAQSYSDHCNESTHEKKLDESATYAGSAKCCSDDPCTSTTAPAVLISKAAIATTIYARLQICGPSCTCRAHATAPSKAAARCSCQRTTQTARDAQGGWTLAK